MQRHWFWVKIHGTPAFDKAVWDLQQFDWDMLWEKILSKDDYEFYAMLLNASSLAKLPNDKLREFIIMFDAINILTHFHPEMIRKIAINVNSIIKHVPARIIDHIVYSIQDLHRNTSHVAPRAVKSSKALQYLFYIGYNRIPKHCLLLKDNMPTVNEACAEWLVKRNCLSLLQEMFQAIPEFEEDHYDDLCISAFENGSLEVLDWLHMKNRMKCPKQSLVSKIAESGHLETIKWLLIKFGDQINWNFVANDCCYSIDPKVSKHLRDNAGVTLSRKATLCLLAESGNLRGLQIALADSLIGFIKNSKLFRIVILLNLVFKGAMVQFCTGFSGLIKPL